MARVAIVTGGTRGIGEAISIALRDMGMKVAANYAGNEERAREFSDRTGIASYRWDVSDFDACQEGVRKVEADLGPVDVLVNSAGIIGPNKPLWETTADEWQATFAVNVYGTVSLCRAVIPAMRERGFGRIVNVASTSVREPIANLMLSNAHRAAMITSFKTIAHAVAGDNVTLNTVLPGRIATDRAYSMADSPEAAEAAAAKEVPAGRMGRPEEMAAAAAFLCSTGAAYITGETIAVDGGMTRSI